MTPHQTSELDDLVQSHALACSLSLRPGLRASTPQIPPHSEIVQAMRKRVTWARLTRRVTIEGKVLAPSRSTALSHRFPGNFDSLKLAVSAIDCRWGSRTSSSSSVGRIPGIGEVFA